MFVPNSKIQGAVVPEKFLTNFPMHYIGVRDGKKEKRRQNKFQHHGLLVHNILQHSVGVYKFEDWLLNLKTLALIGAEKSVMKKCIG